MRCKAQKKAPRLVGPRSMDRNSGHGWSSIRASVPPRGSLPREPQNVLRQRYEWCSNDQLHNRVHLHCRSVKVDSAEFCTISGAGLIWDGPAGLDSAVGICRMRCAVALVREQRGALPGAHPSREERVKNGAHGGIAGSEASGLRGKQVSPLRDGEAVAPVEMTIAGWDEDRVD